MPASPRGELELFDREARTVERRIRDARFPAVKSLESFDFDAIPGLNKKLVLDLARCEFVARRENVIALHRPSGECFAVAERGPQRYRENPRHLRHRAGGVRAPFSRFACEQLPGNGA